MKRPGKSVHSRQRVQIAGNSHDPVFLKMKKNRKKPDKHMVKIICLECNESIEMPNRRFKLCPPCSKNRERKRLKAYHEKFRKTDRTFPPNSVSKTVIIVCKVCSKSVSVPTKRFKMCEVCSRQKKLDRCKKYKEENKERNSTYNAEWKKKHKDDISLYNRRYERERKATDIQFKLLRNIRSRLSQVVKKGISGRTVSETTKSLIGISLKDFVRWLEKNLHGEMSFENYGDVWHVDHVLPCARFDLKNIEERQVCFHWTNMRPLEARKNMQKGDRCTLREILCQEIRAKFFKKDVDFRPLITKFWEKFQNGSSES